MTENTDDGPDVFAYLDFRRFLADWFAWKKSARSEFSYRVFARLSGLSHSTLKNVMSGERSPSPPTLSGFARAMKLDEARQAHLQRLVRLDEARDLRQRSEVLEEILATPEHRLARPINATFQQYLSRWHYVVIREVLSLPGAPQDAAELAACFEGRLTRAEVQEALDDLRRLGLLRWDGDRLVPGDLRLDSEAEVSPDFRDNHRSMIRQALDALDRVPRLQRFFGAATVRVDEAQLQQLRNEALTWIRSMMNNVEQGVGPKDRIVQISVQVFPHVLLPDRDDEE